jgi:general secretion pathway protein D
VVEVNNRSTIVIGGLIDEQQDFSRNAVPCLGSVPAAGWLFKTVGTSETKTNLLVFISPSVYETPEQASSKTKEKEDYMKDTNVRQKQEQEREMPFFKSKSKSDETEQEQGK